MRVYLVAVSGLRGCYGVYVDVKGFPALVFCRVAIITGQIYVKVTVAFKHSRSRPEVCNGGYVTFEYWHMYSADCYISTCPDYPGQVKVRFGQTF